MRVLVVFTFVVLASIHVAPAEARPKPRPAAHAKAKKRVAHSRLSIREIRGPVSGQSVGAPWAGRLQHPAQLAEGDGYKIRRPWRSYGTRLTVDLVQRAINDTLEAFPDAHVLAIGDLSAEHGGAITDHHSHQSGRDADIGLIYKTKPRGYPENFVAATEDNLDCAATFALITSFLASANEDGGVQVVFLDFNVQGLLYDWAKDEGISDDRLDRIFQFPHGRGGSAGLVRHEPNHDNHIHVRFKCPRGDSACR